MNDTPFDLVCLYGCKMEDDLEASGPDGMFRGDGGVSRIAMGWLYF